MLKSHAAPSVGCRLARDVTRVWSDATADLSPDGTPLDAPETLPARQIVSIRTKREGGFSVGIVVHEKVRAAANVHADQSDYAAPNPRDEGVVR